MTHLPGCADGRVYLGDGVYVYCPCAYARPRAESEFAIVARVVREHFAGESA